MKAFWDRVAVLSEDECWIWRGALHSAGYGTLGDRYAHRIAYELKVGPIPQGYDIDHLCRVRPCVNPKHLEAVTHRENVLRGESKNAKNARKTHCIRGHDISAGSPNTYITPSGGRNCRACRAQALRRWRRLQRAA